MAFLTRHCQPRYWPLSGPQSQAPAFADNTSILFNMNDVPQVTQGNKANYVPCLALTAYGTIKTAGNVTGRLSWEDIAVALYQSFDLPGAWHGRPLNNQAMRGPTARIWELIAMGYQYGSRHLELVYSSSGTKAFRHTLYLPLSFLLGDDPLYSSQLAVCYKQAQLNILTAGSGTLLPNGDTVASGGLAATIRCSAVMVPQRSIRLAPGQEWVEFLQQGANASDNAVTLQSFGNATALDGVEPGAGITTLLALCSAGGVGGSWAGNTLSSVAIPFLDQSQTQHMDPFVNAMEQASAMGSRARQNQIVDDVLATQPAILGREIDISGFPYTDFALGKTNTNTLDPELLFLPLIVPGPRLQVTKVPVFEGAVTYQRNVSAASGTDRTLCHQLKSWGSDKIKDWLQLVISSGLAYQVYGTNNLVPKAALNDAASVVNPGKARFLPIEYVPPTTKAA